jgi:hypothetical protein
MTFKLNLRDHITFGFETTFTLPDWWMHPGFCSDWETPQKTELMRNISQALVDLEGGHFIETQDSYKAIQFEVFYQDGTPSFQVTSEPGSIEIKTPPLLLKDLKKGLRPLYQAIEKNGMVAYRSWWYGAKTGTGGGCHLNMAGFNKDTNPFYNDPLLVLKYFAFLHNHPALIYPFMGPDIGHGGNCMRMDEHEAELPLTPNLSMQKFEEARLKLQNENWNPTAEECIHFFKDAKVLTVKHSAPALRKYQAPYYQIEDRAVEALRNEEECFLLSELRIRILEKLQKQDFISELKLFDQKLHHEDLHSLVLWEQFKTLCSSLDLNPEPFYIFWERQFPELVLGESVPQQFKIIEGRRPRKVLGAHEQVGDLILSKKIDTNYKRFELQTHQKNCSFIVHGQTLKPVLQTSPQGEVSTTAFDIHLKPEEKIMISLLNQNGECIETGYFDPHGFLWLKQDLNITSAQASPSASRVSSATTDLNKIYYNLEFLNP